MQLCVIYPHESKILLRHRVLTLSCGSDWPGCLPKGLTLRDEFDHYLKLNHNICVKLMAVHPDTMQKFSYGTLEVSIRVIRHKELLYDHLNNIGMNFPEHLTFKCLENKGTVTTIGTSTSKMLAFFVISRTVVRKPALSDVVTARLVPERYSIHMRAVGFANLPMLQRFSAACDATIDIMQTWISHFECAMMQLHPTEEHGGPWMLCYELASWPSERNIDFCDVNTAVEVVCGSGVQQYYWDGLSE